jgi:hypothetical protein
MLGGSGAGIYHNAVASSSVVNLRNTLLAGNNLDNSPTYDDCHGDTTCQRINTPSLRGERAD